MIKAKANKVLGKKKWRPNKKAISI
jgi:hypothetical protein